MLQLVIPEKEYFDEEKQEFLTFKEQKLNLEHSLISVSKWESKWKKPFLDSKDRTVEEFVDYIRCMTLNTNVDPSVYDRITRKEINEVIAYIDDSMTATWFNEKGQKRPGGRGQVITSELIYYWMIAFQVPSEYEKWHLNRLLTLIRICEVKNQPQKSMKKKDIYKNNAALNAARRKQLGTKG